MKPDLDAVPDRDAVYADRCRQLARHVAAAMTLSRVSAFEAVEMALLASREWFGEKPESREPGGALLAAILAAAAAAAEARLGRKSKAEIATLLAAAVALAGPVADKAGAGKGRPGKPKPRPKPAPRVRN